MTDKIRYGVISTAAIARHAHIPAAAESRFSEIAAISSRDLTRARETAEQHGITRAYGSYDELLADDTIRAVINPLPVALHCEWTIKAAEAGKHVLCEKPLALTPDECTRMIAACRANGVLLYEAFTHPFNPVMPRIHALIAAGEIGDVNMARAELTYTMPDWSTDVRAQADLGGGALYDAGCYCVNTMRAVMGAEPLEVMGAERLHQTNRVDAGFMGVLKFPGERLAFVGTGMEQVYRWPLEILGTKGSLFTPDVFSGEVLEIHVGDERRTERFETVNRFAIQIDHFSSAILQGTPLRVEPEDATRNVAALAALKASARTGKAVSLERSNA